MSSGPDHPGRPSRSRAPGRRPTAPKIPRGVLAPATLPDHDLEEEAEFGRLEFAGLDLSGRDAALVEFDACRFVDTRLGGTELDRSRCFDCRFESCDLANLSARSTALVRAALQNSRATGLRWTEGTLRDVVFDKCKLDLSAFHETKFERVRFEGCNLAQADFMDADLSGGVEFVDCDLSQARFSQARMNGAVLTHCVLDGIEGVTSLRGAVIDPMDLLSLSYTLAQALGIVIAADDAEEAL
ncbi:MAG TPA: pentapeptide repeat-containing protein [Actinopolymorphaceae bacterium]